MKIGCCTNMIATGPDGTGVEYVEKLASMGFDYVELPLAEMSAMSEEDFQGLVQQVERSGIRCEACNNFFPRTMRLTGKDTDQGQIAGYVEKALERAGRLGAEYVVFGSGPAKNIPEGFPVQEGYNQVAHLLRRAAPIAEKNGITIVIEPLRKAECNLINTFAQGCALAGDVGHKHVRVLVDYYHLSQEAEPVQSLLDNGKEYLRHVHFARNEGRVFPRKSSEDDYKPFFVALKGVGYGQRISLEAYSDDFDSHAPASLNFFKHYVDKYCGNNNPY